uniref:Uncharacterized protein n=1 Tax=Oryza meridionalis TaxID=40149 RepID=A0A0E0CWD7_9ORYZ
MSVEAHKLRFVRCPKCLQLLVEYPSISVYQCGGCGAVLRAKNRFMSVTQTGSKPDEHNNISSSLNGSSQDNESACSDGQKIDSSSAQPNEDAVEENIPSTTKDAKSCEAVNQEQNTTTVQGVTPTEDENKEKCPTTDADIRDTGCMVKVPHDMCTGADSSPMLIDKVENIGTSENTDLGKGYSYDCVSDGNAGSDVAAVHIAGEEPGAISNHSMKGEVDSVTDQIFSVSNKNVNCKELDERTNLCKETEAKSCNELIQMEERSQPNEGFHVESHEDLIEELERSLSFSDDEESLLDATGNNELNEALQFQIGSRRFSPGSKMNDASRSDPHGRLIEELERSFSDAEEAAEQHVVVVDKVITERDFGNEHGKVPTSLVAESGHPCEGNISSYDDGHQKSGQSFQQNELTADETEEKEHGLLENDSKINCIHGNEHAMVADNDIAEIHSEHDEDPQLLDGESAKLCEGTISSFDGHLKSGQCFQEDEPTADGNKQKEESHMGNNNVTDCAHEDNAAVVGFSSLSNDGIHCKSPIFNEKEEERSDKYRANQLYQGLSLDSEDFMSIQNFIESQMDGTSSSLSSGSPNQGNLSLKSSTKFKFDRLERLKKIDELRDQLNRLCSKKRLENRYRMKGLEYQPQLSSYYVDQHSQNVDADSIQSSSTLGSYYWNGKQPSYPPRNQFSPPHSCTHCHFGHVETHMPHNYGAWDEFNSYYQPSYAGSSIIDHDSLNSSYKEQKRVVRKHILRPVSGASPFTVCNSCFNLVQMPSDIYISKTKMGKMQCGQCSKVLVLSFPAIHHACANSSKEVASKSNKHKGSIVVKPEDAASHSAESFTRDPVSMNEEYGASFTRSFSTQAGSALAASQSGKNVSDSTLHRLMGYDSASQLLHDLRHSKVYDDGYESFESMVPVSSRVSRRKNT